MKVIGITGGVGCGKSTVLNLIKENFNALIIMADDVAKDLMKKGKKGYDETIAFFGDEIIDETTGEIDRPKLASVIFSNPNKRIVLNSIIHPVVKKEIVSMITQAKIDDKYDYIFVEAALLLDDHYNVFFPPLDGQEGGGELTAIQLVKLVVYRLSRRYSLFKLRAHFRQR